MTSALDGFTKIEFDDGRWTREVYRIGSGPAVIVIHEMPGLHPGVLAFARDVAAAGMTVFCPSLFGTPAKTASLGYALGEIAKTLCVRREFNAWATDRSSPIVDWLRALARQVHQECGGKGVGAVGMCFTGGFALAMMVDDIMVAPVLSQPSMPFPVGKARAADLNLSPDDALVVARRAAEGCQVLGLRYTGDKLVGTRFETLRHLLGDAFIAVELPSTKSTDHSVLTEQRDDESVQKVLTFFQEKLSSRT